MSMTKIKTTHCHFKEVFDYEVVFGQASFRISSTNTISDTELNIIAYIFFYIEIKNNVTSLDLEFLLDLIDKGAIHSLSRGNIRTLLVLDKDDNVVIEAIHI